MASKRLKFDKKEITEIADTLNQSTQSLINLLAKQSEISPGAVPNVSQAQIKISSVMVSFISLCYANIEARHIIV